MSVAAVVRVCVGAVLTARRQHGAAMAWIVLFGAGCSRHVLSASRLSCVRGECMVCVGFIGARVFSSRFGCRRFLVLGVRGARHARLGVVALARAFTGWMAKCLSG